MRRMSQKVAISLTRAYSSVRRSSARRAVKVEVRSSGILAYQRVPEGVVISGITADGENLYWLNYGTRDHLGNYNNDGALLAYSFQSRVTRTVVAALSGPVDLEVTIAHAYFLEDGGPLNGGVAKPIKLRRVASDGRGVEAATSPRAKPSFRPCPLCSDELSRRHWGRYKVARSRVHVDSRRPAEKEEPRARAPNQRPASV